MHTLVPLSKQKPFRCHRTAKSEIVIYPSDKEKQHQDREALVTTAWTDARLSAGEGHDPVFRRRHGLL